MKTFSQYCNEKLNLEPKTKLDYIIEIEEILEKGPCYALLISNELGITSNKAGDLMRSMVRQGILEKREKIFTGGAWHKLYAIASPKTHQTTLINIDPVRRDPLIAALFGDYKPCD